MAMKEELDSLERKGPCWKLMDCPAYVYEKCPAYLYPERSCWSVPYTASEVLTGLSKDCKYCKVWRLYQGTNPLSFGLPKATTTQWQIRKKWSTRLPPFVKSISAELIRTLPRNARALPPTLNTDWRLKCSPPKGNTHWLVAQSPKSTCKKWLLGRHISAITLLFLKDPEWLDLIFTYSAGSMISIGDLFLLEHASAADKWSRDRHQGTDWRNVSSSVLSFAQRLLSTLTRNTGFRFSFLL